MKSRLPVLIVGVLVVLSLTGCVQAGGPDARSWLEGHAIVKTVKLDYNTEGLEQKPELAATIDPVASDSALEKLADASSRYLADHSHQPLTIELSASGIIFFASAKRSSALDAEWAALRHDRRVTSGFVTDDVQLDTPRASILPVYQKFVDSGAPLTVDQSDLADEDSGIHLGGSAPCAPTAQALSFASAAIANTSVVAAAIDPCGSSRLLVDAVPQILPMVVQLHAEGTPRVTVGYDADKEVGNGDPDYAVSVDRASPPVVALLSRLATLPQIDGYALATDGSLTVSAQFAAAAKMVYSDPGFASLRSLTLEDDGDTILAPSTATFEPDYMLTSAVKRITSEGYTTITPTTITVTLPAYTNTDLDTYKKYGRPVIAAIARSSLWRGRTVSVENDDAGSVQFVNGTPRITGEATASSRAYIGYWNSLTG